MSTFHKDSCENDKMIESSFLITFLLFMIIGFSSDFVLGYFIKDENIRFGIVMFIFFLFAMYLMGIFRF